MVTIHACIHRITLALLYLWTALSISVIKLTLVDRRKHAFLELDTLSNDFLISLMVRRCLWSCLTDKVGSIGFNRIQLQMCSTHVILHLRQSSSDLWHLAFSGCGDRAFSARIIFLVYGVPVIQMILNFLPSHLVINLRGASNLDSTVLLRWILVLECLLIEVYRSRSIVSWTTSLRDLLASRHFESLANPLCSKKLVNRATVVSRSEIQLF